MAARWTRVAYDERRQAATRCTPPDGGDRGAGACWAELCDAEALELPYIRDVEEPLRCEFAREVLLPRWRDEHKAAAVAVFGSTCLGLPEADGGPPPAFHGYATPASSYRVPLWAFSGGAGHAKTALLRAQADYEAVPAADRDGVAAAVAGLLELGFPAGEQGAVHVAEVWTRGAHCVLVSVLERMRGRPAAVLTLLRNQDGAPYRAWRLSDRALAEHAGWAWRCHSIDLAAPFVPAVVR